MEGISLPEKLQLKLIESNQYVALRYLKRDRKTALIFYLYYPDEVATRNLRKE
jgi:hypothetical protein